MKPLHNLLRQTIGLHAATVGSSFVDRVARARMQHHHLTREEDYLELLKRSPVEWHIFVESVVITETWFFRDEAALVALADLARKEWLPARPTGLLRLLSVPCSSGEEPYSMAMALLDAGLPPERFRIDACDLSVRALVAAEQAVYGRNSFRGEDLAFRERYFEPTDKGYRLKPSVRRLVRFFQGNLLDRDCLHRSGIYDFVFCRNLLIYFDSGTQQKTLVKLSRMLKDTGTLFVSPAEKVVAVANGFDCAGVGPGLVRGRSATSKGFPAPLPRPLVSAARRGRLRRLTATVAKPPTAARKLPPDLAFSGAPARTSVAAASLEDAQRLADEGRFVEAAEICEAHLRQQGVSAQAYYLLGVVRGAVGADSQAGEFFRRALYLEPDHYPALKQWALLSEKNGDSARARMLHERAERVRIQL